MSDDALIEAMARALCKSQGRNPDHVIVASNPEYPWWHASVADATAALAAIRKTHAVVPRDPSEAMVIAMVDEWGPAGGTLGMVTSLALENSLLTGCPSLPPRSPSREG